MQKAVDHSWSLWWLEAICIESLTHGVEMTM